MAPPLDLKDLRNLSKRDPSGYHAEFLLQYRHFQTQLQIFLLKPSEDYKPFSELVEYLCHVSDLYTKDMPNFPEQISNLLEKNCDVLASQLRRSLVSSLILLRSKNQVTPHSVLSLFFKLFRCHDAGLREMLYKHIVNDITNINKKHKNQSLNTALQNFMFDMMQDPVEIAAKQSLTVMIELYRKRVWNDAKTVNVISTGCFSKFTSVVVATLKFFLTVADDDEEDKIAENKAKASEIIKRMTLKRNVKKMNHGRRAKIDEAIAEAHAMRIPHRKLDPNWPAIELINDPQGYAEKVFGVVRHSFERIEVRLMMMNFISRLISVHKLLLLNFYPFVQKYLMPKNEHVTYALAILAQCIHELIPPTDLQPIVKHLVDKFVHDRSSTESIVAGLHTLREMSSRNPLIMNDTLVRDLAQYKTYKDRAVMAAARGIISVYREKNPELLERKDRGKEAVQNLAAGVKPLEYGQTKVTSGVDDIELLDLVEKLEKQEAMQKVDEIDMEGNVISYDDEEDEGEGEEDGDDESMEDEEMDGEEEEEIDSEEEKLIAIEKAARKKGKGGVIATEGVMSIAEALRLEEMQKKLIEKQLINRERRKRGLEEILSSDEEEEDEDEDEEEEGEEEEEEQAEQPQEEKPEEIDIWQRIAFISDGIVPEPAAKTVPAANGTAKSSPAANGAAKTGPATNGAAKTGPATNGAAKTGPAANGAAKTGPAANGATKTGPATNGTAKTEAPAKSAKPAKPDPASRPAKKAKLEVEEVEEEEDSDEEDLEEIESGDEDMWEEVSGDEEGEEDEEGEWEDISEEEEGANGKEKNKAAAVKKTTTSKEAVKEKEKEKLPEKVNMEHSGEKKSDEVRILSEADFEKLNRLKQMKAEGKISLRRLKELAKNLEQGGESSEEEEGTGFVDPSDLTRGIKAQRKRGEERMAEILEKRKESKDNSRHKEKLKWTTNEEKSKHKNLMMLVKGKMYAKTKLSMREQQIKKQAGIKRFKTRRHK